MTDEGPSRSQTAPYPPPEDVPVLTDRDRAYASVYVQILDATAAGADWQTIARHVLKLDPNAMLTRPKGLLIGFMLAPSG